MLSLCGGTYGELLYLLGGIGGCLLVLVVECFANCFCFNI